MLLMLSRRRGSYEEVIQISKGEGEASKNVIDEALKSLSCTPQTERHACVLKEAKRSDDGRLRYVLYCDWDLVVSSYKIQFGKDALTCQIRGERLDVRDRVAIWYCASVQSPKISHRPPIRSTFRHHVDCLLYTSDAADERSSVDLGGRRII